MTADKGKRLLRSWGYCNGVLDRLELANRWTSMFVVKSLGREVLPEVGLEVLRQEVPVQRPVQEPNLNSLTLLIL
jgi:hypothetical protein